MLGGRRGQQEIAGFVLIVVVVVIALMVFLVISIRSSGDEDESLEVSNILDAVMKHTTGCAIVYEPDYDNFEDLFKSCYRGHRCKNLEVDACDYLNESLTDLLASMMKTESSVGSYQLDFFVKDAGGLLQISEGNCTGQSSGAQRSVISDSESLIIRMQVCSVFD